MIVYNKMYILSIAFCKIFILFVLTFIDIILYRTTCTPDTPDTPDTPGTPGTGTPDPGTPGTLYKCLGNIKSLYNDFLIIPYNQK